MAALALCALWAPLSGAGCAAWWGDEAPDTAQTIACARWLLAADAATLAGLTTAQLQRAISRWEAAAAPPDQAGDPAVCRGPRAPLDALALAPSRARAEIQRRRSTFDARRGEDFEPLLKRALSGAPLPEALAGWSGETLRRLRAAVYARHGRPLESPAMEALFYEARGDAPPRATPRAAPTPLSAIDERNLRQIEAALTAHGG
ncbi:YARHG domain-containing protein [Myxococcota bacterium]|nr:YARHG domain-containing protein [Myxococcota bacterium]MBU1431914.1 YARHG domain-containing protein [Myxococcota bacterium]MBU1900424.1 YARHG domain-containing protein [Myxococcota bacterium]